MSVGGEAAVPPRPRPLAVVRVWVLPIRHFAKLAPSLQALP